ncbi:MAG: hypothetical protein ACOC95_10485 [Planctomycetota bacterium]
MNVRHWFNNYSTAVVDVRSGRSPWDLTSYSGVIDPKVRLDPIQGTMAGDEVLGNFEIDYVTLRAVSEASALPGDADGDDDVDLDDFVLLKSNFGTASGATAAEGDFDGDGDVDLDDFVILKSNFGTTR